MFQRIPWLLLLILMASCYRNSPKAEFDMSVIIPPDSMVLLLTDLHLVEGIASTSREKDSVLTQLVDSELNIVLDKLGLNRKSYEENMRYYSYHTEELDKIYEKVITNLGMMESRVKSEGEIVQDSTAENE